MRTLAFLVLVSSALPAVAKSVYINGAKVDGATNLKLANVDVEIDAVGDVRITAKGYKIEVKDVEPARPLLKQPARRYFIAQTLHGDAQWSIDVFVNNTFVKRFRSRLGEPPFEITRYVHGGDNGIRFRAIKDDGARLSTSAADYIELVVGEGMTGGAQVMLDSSYTFRRTGAETGVVTSDAPLVVK